jgi:hypothetical protein
MLHKPPRYGPEYPARDRGDSHRSARRMRAQSWTASTESRTFCVAVSVLSTATASPPVAIRYGIGVGRPGFTWSGTHTISGKKNGPTGCRPMECSSGSPICRISWRAARTTLRRALSISVRRSIECTDRTSSGLSAQTYRPAASAYAIRMSLASTSGWRSAHRSWYYSGLRCCRRRHRSCRRNHPRRRRQDRSRSRHHRRCRKALQAVRRRVRRHRYR